MSTTSDAPQTGRRVDDGLQHRLDLGSRIGNRAQDLAGRRLLVERLRQSLFEPT